MIRALRKNLEYEHVPEHTDLRILVKSKPSWEECDFWVVFYPQGDLDSDDVIRAKTFTDIFDNVISQGIKDSRRLMYVDTSFHKHKSLYLLFYPESLYNTQDTWDLWLEDLVSFLVGSPPKALGLYFGEEIFTQNNLKDHLVRFIDRLMTENISLDSLTLLTILKPHHHLLESAHYAQKCLQHQYHIEVDARDTFA